MRLAEHPFVYGYYRYLNFGDRSVDDLMALPPTAGRTREHPPNAWHLYYSGFSGLFACDAELLRSIGWDMIYNLATGKLLCMMKQQKPASHVKVLYRT